MNSTARPSVLMSGVRYGIAILVSCALIAPAAAQTAQQQPADARESRQKTVGSSIIVDAEEIVRDPSKYYGKKVMIQPADVNRVLGPHAFMLDEDALLAGPDVLVIVPNPTGGAIGEDAEVRVTGTVRPYVAADIRRDFNWFDEDDVVVEFTDRPVIVADSVTSSDGREWAGAITQVPAQPAGGSGHEVLTAGAIAGSPQEYLGQRVTVRAEIEDVYNPQLFTLDEDRMFVGPDVIVYLRDGRTSLTGDQEDQIVTVTGEVRKFIESDLFGTATWFEPWFRDLDETGRGLVRSRPVIIADSVTASNGAQLYTTNTASPGSATATETDAAVGTSGTTASGTSGEPSNPPARFTAGNSVAVTGTIQNMATDRAFWLTVDGRNQPIMVIVDAAQLAAMTGGEKPQVSQRVAVSGMVKEVPGTEGSGTATDFGLKPEDANRLKQQRIYIHAETVNPAKQ